MNLRSKSLGWVVECAHNVVVAVDVKLTIALESHFTATVFRKEDNIADFNVDGAELTVVKNATRTNSNDCALVKLLTLLCASKDDSTLCLCFGDDFFDNDTVS